MRLLTKAEACRELAVSLSTLDRRIASGELVTRREPRGRRHRVYVMLDDDPPESGADAESAPPWPRSGFAAWRSMWPCCKGRSKRNWNAPPDCLTT